MGNPERFNKDTLVSIIIPCKEIDFMTRRCLFFCHLFLKNIEIIVVPDSVCPGKPGAKRNWAIERAKGEVIAFLDSDAFPSFNWLNNALPLLNSYAAVCGPGVLPSHAPLLEQATDLVLKCMPYAYRVTPKKARIVAEFPTFNLIVRKDKCVPFKNYLTGEDTLFCRELEGKILYDPSVLVYHNRRPLFKPYWKQISTYGLHRGHLIRLALLGWLSTWFVYGVNFIKGLTRRKI